MKEKTKAHEDVSLGLAPNSVCWGVMFQTPAGCLTVQLNSDSIYQETESDSTG